MNKITLSNITVILVLVLLGCSSPSENEPAQEPIETFTPLFLGIEKQFKFLGHEIYWNHFLNETELRDDGQKVFIFEVSTSPEFLDRYKNYRFVRNGFLFYSSLKDNGPESNPFSEARISKPFLKPGETWENVEYNANTDTVRYTVEKIAGLSIPAGYFNEVASIKTEFRNDTNSYYSLYAKGFGLIGRVTNQDSFLVNYIKVGEKEMGERVTFD